jgi:release factor glutamine methyltransferase
MLSRAAAEGATESCNDAPRSPAAHARDAARARLRELGLAADLELRRYDPLGALGDRYLCARARAGGPDLLLLRVEAGVCTDALRLPASGQKPGHGLLLGEHLGIARGDRFADVGTGPLGFLGVLAAGRGAARVLGIDRDPASVRSARALAASVHGARMLRGDALAALAPATLDRVAVHPPMRPADRARPADPSRAPHYDDAGPDGRAVLDRVIAGAALCLAAGGSIRIGQFEFLGVERRFGAPPCTFEVLRAHGLAPRVVASYAVPVVDAVRERLGAVRRTYPDYPFAGTSNAPRHRFVVVEGRRGGA